VTESVAPEIRSRGAMLYFISTQREIATHSAPFNARPTPYARGVTS
jgi:hypothetical protein